MCSLWLIKKFANNGFYKNLILCCDKVTLRPKKKKFELQPDSFGDYGLPYVGEFILKAIQSNTLVSNRRAASA